MFLTDTLVLALPSGKGSFVIYPDALKDELECILTIHDETIVYVSRKLISQEKVANSWFGVSSYKFAL